MITMIDKNGMIGGRVMQVLYKEHRAGNNLTSFSVCVCSPLTNELSRVIQDHLCLVISEGLDAIDVLALFFLILP